MYEGRHNMPDVYGYNANIESIRDAEYPSLKECAYLDHGGSTIPAVSLINEHAAQLNAHLFGNPHSHSTPAVRSTKRIDAIRKRTLRFFKADPEDFDLVFVANATAAIKIVMQSFYDLTASSHSETNARGRDSFWYGYHRDAHTSIVGIREMSKCAHQCFHNDEEVEAWLEQRPDSTEGPLPGQLGLFAYPGQSNMTGRRLSLDWSGRLRQSSLGDHTYTLLDAAALATTTQLDLSDNATAPDFVALSFYKIFGYPDLGALIVRKDSGHILQWRKYFGGGTVDMITSIDDCWHMRKDYTVDSHYSLHDQLEDGTLPFHSIIALDAALDVHTRLFGTMSDVSKHTAYLTKRLFNKLSSLQHWNATPLCRIYNDASATYGDSKTQGATVAFNIQRADRSLVPYTEVERLADEHSIYVRSGGLCNPGGIATHLGLKPWEMKRAWSAGHRCGHATEIVSGKPTGVVRASLGAMSTVSDVDRLVELLTSNYVEQKVVAPVALPIRSDSRPAEVYDWGMSPRVVASMDSPRLLKPSAASCTVFEVLASDPTVGDKQLRESRSRVARKWVKKASSHVSLRRAVRV